MQTLAEKIDAQRKQRAEVPAKIEAARRRHTEWITAHGIEPVISVRRTGRRAILITTDRTREGFFEVAAWLEYGDSRALITLVSPSGEKTPALTLTHTPDEAREAQRVFLDALRP